MKIDLKNNELKILKSYNKDDFTCYYKDPYCQDNCNYCTCYIEYHNTLLDIINDIY